MIRAELEKVIAGNDLSFDESHHLMLNIMSGEENNSQIAALLTALKIKGEVPEEVAGFASAMREKSIKVDISADNVVDVCGTGGDNSGTFNISTSAAFVVAGAGIKVAKHGNRSISSKSGSADVLTELGINISLSAQNSAKAIEDIGISFLFAPDYHPAMKHVGPVRNELAMKTVFNILGPLTNPAGTKKQMIGTFNDRTAEIMAKAAVWLKMEKVCFICTEDKFDEILLRGGTRLFEYSKERGIRIKNITHKDFDLPEVKLSHIQGKSPENNAQILTNILSGKEKGAPFYVTIANAAMALYAADLAHDLSSCTDAAREAIESGQALDKLNQLREYGKLKT